MLSLYSPSQKKKDGWKNTSLRNRSPTNEQRELQRRGALRSSSLQHSRQPLSPDPVLPAAADREPAGSAERLQPFLVENAPAPGRPEPGQNLLRRQRIVKVGGPGPSLPAIEVGTDR